MHIQWHPGSSWPSEGVITQRAVMTAHGRQFVLNGCVALSKKRGTRLIVTETFGTVLADVLVKPDGEVLVLKSSSAFTPKRIRDFVAEDLKCVFEDSPPEGCRVRSLGQGRYVIERQEYSVYLRTLDIKPGSQPAELFDVR